MGGWSWEQRESEVRMGGGVVVESESGVGTIVAMDPAISSDYEGLVTLCALT